MKNKLTLFLWWLIKLPFRVIFYLVGVLVALLTAFMLGIIGKNKK